MTLPSDLHTFLLLVGGPAALMWIVSHLLERNNRFQALTIEHKSWLVLGIAVALAFISYGLAAWDAGMTVTITPQLIYTIALSGITNWYSGNFYHAKIDSAPAATTPAAPAPTISG